MVSPSSNQLHFNQWLQQTGTLNSAESIKDRKKIRKAFEIFADSALFLGEIQAKKKQKISSEIISFKSQKTLIEDLKNLLDKTQNTTPLETNIIPTYFTQNSTERWNECIQILSPTAFHQLQQPTTTQMVEQGEFLLLEANNKEKNLLITVGVTPCIALLARAFDENDCILYVGLAHYDSIDLEGDLIFNFLDALKGAKVKKIDLILIGGEDILDEEKDFKNFNSREMTPFYEIFDDIAFKSKEFSTVSLSIQKKIINPYQVRRSNHDYKYILEFDLVGYTSHTAIQTNGNVLVSFESILPQYDEDTLKNLSLFMKQNISEMKELVYTCQKDSMFKNELLRLLIAILSDKNWPELKKTFAKGVEIFIELMHQDY